MSTFSGSRAHLPNTTPQRKASTSEPPKPFSNFPIFHDRLLERLKGINQLHMLFERRTKELEERFVDQLQ